ncbi:hypothetical protein SCHPADRAFT_561204 [Schizopora paradoxa]|uniref:Transcription activator of gluconeogenesis ERT1 n=1 Tax=Schizopora paradoxa TaxID=27342 RepID=A0A0H2RJE5_9AGAM|nr:hypothetical protein SCHPADRAFT_561204 [Schizopora paradoxa]
MSSLNCNYDAINRGGKQRPVSGMRRQSIGPVSEPGLRLFPSDDHEHVLAETRSKSVLWLRDKIRCDGARPCSGCLKKGIYVLCIDGCAQCRRSREICDGRKPCQNCDERHLDCEEEDSSPVSRQEVIPLAMPSQAKAGERAKLACLACRRDNKKCGDQRPCSRCISRSEECIHINRGPKIVKSRCHACREQNRKCEDVRPCRHCAELGEQCYDLPRKGRGHGTRVKTACIACRRNKTQCESSRPCNNCKKRGLDCIDKGCTCIEQVSGTKCLFCRSTTKIQENGAFPPSFPLPVDNNAQSFSNSVQSTNLSMPFGFPQSNAPTEFQNVAISPFDIDPLLIGSSELSPQ